ncbi:hypothetical protein JAAARDRAFT_610831 [Jaapia argillacea MUCL 33604]|uniref:Uncharacterized protein n=1 Tax=Jaapia argillacea MUCL 33604 TaxID=933084 RepID=A0A067P4Y9_9AGAM|nr:hypothetical protein JAAARDRAFT_610831 [Jaapia argillacea MUCL 33604]
MAVPLTLSLSFSSLAYLFVLPYGVLAQTPPGAPECNITSPPFPTVNSKGQDICFIAHTVWGMCTGNWTWAPVITDVDLIYTPPSDGCQCSIVIYNLVSGCAFCQSGLGVWFPWIEWSFGCTASEIAAESAVPLNATVPFPNWAYIDPRVRDQFSVVSFYN